MSRLGDLYRLLRPHAAPHVVPLLLVVVLGTGSAMLQKGAYMLLQPTWTVLFPEAEQDDGAEAKTAAGAESSEDDDSMSFLGSFGDTVGGWRDSATDWIVGDRETLNDTSSEASKAQKMGALFKIAGIVALMAIFAALCQYGMGVISGHVGLRMMVSLRMELAEHLMGLSMRYHSGRKFGDLLSRISSDVGTTTRTVQVVLKDLVQEPLQVMVSLGACFLIAPVLTLWVLVGLPIFIAPIAVLLKKVRKSSHKSATQLGSTFQVLTQMFQGVRTVKAYRAEDRELERFRDTNETYVAETMRMVRASVMSRAWTIFITNFGIAAVVVVAGWLVVQRGALDNGAEMLLFFLMLSQASSHLKRVTRSVAEVNEAQGAAQRLLDLSEEKADVVERSDAHALQSIGTGIRFEGVGFEYPKDDSLTEGAERFAIAGIDLHVHPGETLALVGPSGSGKSTLLDLVARFVDPTSGRVTVDGHDLRDLTFDSWTSHYALVTQSPFLFHASIAENIRYGKPDATDAEVEAAARAANIHEFILTLNDGYGTDVKDAGTRLSGGQRQRITIARALLRDPELLLLDEATSALDTESEAVVQAALEEMMVGRTTIVIAHRLSTIRNADRIAVLDGGRVVELGTHAELLEQDGVYARLNQAQLASKA